MSEANLLRSIMLEVSKIGTRIFRFNVGMAWMGKVQRFPAPVKILVNPEDIVIRNAYPVHFGFEGMSDLMGWTPIDGKAIFTAIEVKAPEGKTHKDRLLKQTNFVNQVTNAGGIGMFAHSPEEAIHNIKERLKKD